VSAGSIGQKVESQWDLRPAYTDFSVSSSAQQSVLSYSY